MRSDPLQSVDSLDWLRTFVIFAESDTIVDAAKKLRLSQPAVSMQLKKLEQALKKPIFAYEGKKKVLTHFGRALYRSSKKGMSNLGLLLEQVDRRYSVPESLILKVGARKEIFHRVAHHIQFSGQIRFMNMSTEQAIRGLTKHTIDVAISHEAPDLPEIIAKKLFANGVKCVVHRKWLADLDIPEDKRTGLDLIREKNFLTRIPVLIYRDHPPFLTEWVSQNHLRLEDLIIRCVCEDWLAIMKFVEDGMGYSILPEDVETFSDEVVSIPIPKSLIPEVSYCALYHRDLKKIPAFREVFM